MAAFTAAMIGLAIAGMAKQAYDQHEAGQNAAAAGDAQQRAANDQADIQDYNAHVADLQAQDAVERGAELESRFRTQVKNMIGTQRVGQAANRVDVGYGTPVDVQADAAFLGELDAHTIRTNAARQAWGFQVQAADLRAGASITRRTGANQALAGQQQAHSADMAAVGSLLGGTTSLLMQRYGFGSNTSSSRSLDSPRPENAKIPWSGPIWTPRYP